MRGTGNLTIAALRERIARGELTHEALIQQVLDAAALPSAQHVFTKTYADAALAAARHADAAQKAGLQLGALPNAKGEGIRPAAQMEIELRDPRLQRRIVHRYAVNALPVVA